MIKSEFTYIVKLTDTRRSNSLAFEFDDPEDATMFACTALRTYDAIYELMVNMQIVRKLVLQEENKHELVQS